MEVHIGLYPLCSQKTCNRDSNRVGERGKQNIDHGEQIAFFSAHLASLLRPECYRYSFLHVITSGKVLFRKKDQIIPCSGFYISYISQSQIIQSVVMDPIETVLYMECLLIFFNKSLN